MKWKVLLSRLKYSELNPNIRRIMPIVAIAVVVILFVAIVCSSAKSEQEIRSASAVQVASEQQSDALIKNLKTLHKNVERHTRIVIERNAELPIEVSDTDEVVRTIASPEKGENYIPIGTTILVESLNRITSGNEVTPVVARLPYTMSLGGTRRIDKGSRFIGRARTNFEQKRVFIDFHHLVTLDHKEITIEAVALDPFGGGGLSGVYKTKDLERLLSMFGLNLIGAISDIGQERMSLPEEGISVRKLSPKNVALEGASRTARDESDRMVQEAAGNIDKSIEIEGRSYMKVFFLKGFYAEPNE